MQRPATQPVAGLLATSAATGPLARNNPSNVSLASDVRTRVGRGPNAARCLMSTVLLVEDELLVRELASEDLAEAGFEVICASDGDEALVHLKDGRQFDLLFTDIRMPGTTDGWQLAEQAKSLVPGIKVIYATGLGEAADQLAQHERYVRKPYNLNDLRKVLGELGFQT